jgi:hypothetical protein
MSSLIEKLTELICSVSLFSMQNGGIKSIEIVFKIFTLNIKYSIKTNETNYLPN